MNLQHIKYAVVVAECGSISKAADQLYVAQPNLSRAIRELENELGFEIFRRSSRGMTITSAGEHFIRTAANIVRQVEDIEKSCRTGMPIPERFSVSASGNEYLAEAFIQFVQKADKNTEVMYEENTTMDAIENVVNSVHNLAVISYPVAQESYFSALCSSKGLTSRHISSYKRMVLTSADSAIADRKTIGIADLNLLTEIVRRDIVSSLSATGILRQRTTDGSGKIVYAGERNVQIRLLHLDKNAYMLTAPWPAEALARNGLVQLELKGNDILYRDALISRKDYRLSETDHLYIAELMRQRVAERAEKDAAIGKTGAGVKK